MKFRAMFVAIYATWVPLLIMLLLLPVTGKAQFTFTTNLDGTLNISAYTGSGHTLIIPDATNGLPITTIGATAFDNGDMFNLTIGTNIIFIGPGAFMFCLSMRTVTIPNSVTTIGNTAFSFCSALKNVTVPNSVTNFGGAGIFSFCSSLTNVTLSTNLNSIPDLTFERCSKLTGIIIPNIATSIGGGAFSYCSNLASIVIPNKVTNIGQGAFQYSGLTNVSFGNSVNTISNFAFADCPGLKTVTIPSTVTSIGNAAFAYNASLTGAYFQGDAPDAGSSAFFTDNNPTVYYLPGTMGWSSTLGSAPTAFWSLPYPLILNKEPTFGIQGDSFGFTISWATNISVVVEASANLSNPTWISVSTCTLTGGTNYFSDPQWADYPNRFYRLRSP